MTDSANSSNAKLHALRRGRGGNRVATYTAGAHYPTPAHTTSWARRLARIDPLPLIGLAIIALVIIERMR